MIEAQLLNAAWEPTNWPADLRITVNEYTVNVKGGPLSASISAKGDQFSVWDLAGLLGQAIALFDTSRNRRVWIGKLNRMDVTVGSITVGLTLDGVANRVLVSYTTPNVGGFGTGNIATDTAWAINQDSIDAFGIKELRVGATGVSAAAAAALRDVTLNDKSRPMGVLNLADDTAPGGRAFKVEATAIGLWETLSWQYFGLNSGIESYDASAAGLSATSEPFRLGVAIAASARIGFLHAGPAILDLDGRFANIKAGDQVIVTGSASNNKTVNVVSVENNGPQLLTDTNTGFLDCNIVSGTQIGFTVDELDATHAYISDFPGRMNVYKAGDRFTITGATNGANNRQWTVKQAASDTGKALEISNTIDIQGTATNRIRSATIDIRKTFRTGDLINIAGSSGAGNNGLARVLSTGIDGGGMYYLHVSRTLATVASGTDNVSLQRGNTVEVSPDSTMINELTGGLITLTFNAYRDVNGVQHDPAQVIHNLVNSFLGPYRVGDLLEVTGSASNNRIFNITEKDSNGRMLFVRQPVVTTAAGASVTLRGSTRIVTKEPLNDEFPGASVTLNLWQNIAIAQQIGVASSETWTVASVEVRVRKIGAPADNLQVGIWSDTAGAPGALIEQVAVAGSTLGTALSWTSFTFANTAVLSLNPTKYWIVVDRTGSQDPLNAYEVDVQVAAVDGYTRGTPSRKTSTPTWVAITSVNGTPDMPFKLLGSVDTATLINRMSAVGQFIAGTEVLTSTGILSSQYRDGKKTALDELRSLLNLGTSSGLALQAMVDIDRFVVVDIEPAKPTDLGVSSPWSLSSQGWLMYLGSRVDDADCPVGMWVTLGEPVIATASVALTSDFMTQFVEQATYDVARQRLRLQTRTADAALDIGALSVE